MMTLQLLLIAAAVSLIPTIGKLVQALLQIMARAIAGVFATILIVLILITSTRHV